MPLAQTKFFFLFWHWMVLPHVMVTAFELSKACISSSVFLDPQTPLKNRILGYSVQVCDFFTLMMLDLSWQTLILPDLLEKLGKNTELYRVFHINLNIRKQHISASRWERTILKTVSERSLTPILLCKISWVSLKYFGLHIVQKKCLFFCQMLIFL